MSDLRSVAIRMHKSPGQNNSGKENRKVWSDVGRETGPALMFGLSSSLRWIPPAFEFDESGYRFDMTSVEQILRFALAAPCKPTPRVLKQLEDDNADPNYYIFQVGDS